MGIVVKLPDSPAVTRTPDKQAPPPLNPNPTKEYAAEIRAFLDRKAPYDHPLRIRRASTWRKADLYDQSIQWLQASYNLDPTRTMHWSEISFTGNDKDDIPRPVLNEMSAARQNESARLGRPEYKAYVRPSGETPDTKTKQAAKDAGEILQAGKDDMDWDIRVAEIGFFHMPHYGGWGLKSWWDVSYEKTTRVGVLSAMKCPAEGCDFKVANPELNEREFAAVEQQKPGLATKSQFTDEKGDERLKFSVDSCLTCDEHDEEVEEMSPASDPASGQPLMGPDGAYVMVPTKTTVKAPGPPKLEAFTPVDEELNEQDSFGKDLGQDVQLGEWKCKTLNPYDVFWANLGQTNDPHGWEEVTEFHVESLDWVRSHYPEKADDVKPEAQEALLKYHPIGGERAVFFGTAGGDSVFANHVRVKEFHKKPYMECGSDGKWAMNRGRSIIMAGDVLLLDASLLMESRNNKGVFIPRVHYDYAPWEYRSGGLEKDGMSMPELLFDVQDNINEAKSQTQDTRQRMGSPKWLVRRGMNLDYESSGNAGAHWQFDGNPDDPSAVPQEVGSTTISAGVDREIERDLEYITRTTSRDVEKGAPPTGVTAASALQLIAVEAGEHRRPRIRRVRKMFERVWKHGLELMHEFVREPRTYRVKDETNEWRDRTWTGMSIAGQTDVRIDAEPEHDTVLQAKENMIQAVNMRSLDPVASKRAAMMINKKLEIPRELYEDDDVQYESAGREFWDYMDLGKPPVIDPDLDDPASHLEQHGKDMLSEPWRELEAIAKWDDVSLWLWGWEEIFPNLQMVEGAQWPPALELQIIECWKFLLNGINYFGQQPRDKQELAALDRVIRWRAHHSGHKMALERKQMMAQAGMPVAAAPEAEATAAGTMATASGAPGPAPAMM